MYNYGAQISHVQSFPPRSRPPHLVREVKSQIAGTKGKADQAPPHAHLSTCGPSRGPRGIPTAAAGVGPPPQRPGPPRGPEFHQSARGPPPSPARLLKGPCRLSPRRLAVGRAVCCWRKKCERLGEELGQRREGCDHL